MLTIASLLAAMTIAGAFWVGVLAARRLRDWGEGRRALEEGGGQPLALAAASGTVPDDPRTRRIRARLVERMQRERWLGSGPARPRSPGAAASEEDLGLDGLRPGDVLVVESGEPDDDGDWIVDGLVQLREGGATSVVAIVSDGDRRRWLVGGAQFDPWLFVEPVLGHGLGGEPPRNIVRGEASFGLQRRGQASAACIGKHDRPELPRVATYVYGAGGRDVLWLERWDETVLVGQGRALEPASVGFLPGS
jgi:hypothetical protein